MWKEALVTPTLKKCGSDLAFKNSRPISNLQFVSKLVERTAADQQFSLIWLRIISLLCSSQHIVLNHSTETSLLKIKNEYILMDMDKQHIAVTSYPSGLQRRLWHSWPSNSPKQSMHKIWCVWKSSRMDRLVLIKSLSESYSRWCIVRPVWYQFWGPTRQLSRSSVIRHLFQ